MEIQKKSNRLWIRYVVAIGLIAVGMGLRIWPLGGLGLRIPYVTFYPAVMAAALYGGFNAGFLYADEPTPAAATWEDELDVAQLKKLPPALIRKLREAAVLLDDQNCLKVAGMINDHNHDLGERLRCMVENFRYKEMLAVLDNLTEGVS